MNPIEKTFGDLLSAGTAAGNQLLNAEISKHGNKAPETRPDPTTIPAAGSVAASPGVPPKKIDKKTMIMIGGGLLLAVGVVLVLRK